MAALRPGEPAPPQVPADGGAAVVFYKVTCPTCQVAAPAMERLYRTFPDRFVAVVQDPEERAEGFARSFGVSFPSRVDAPPYEVSEAFGVEVVPTVFAVADGEVRDVAESWDRDGWNRVAATLAGLVGSDPVTVSEEGDGLPPFRPG